jgi:hypothetical protein
MNPITSRTIAVSRSAAEPSAAAKLATNTVLCKPYLLLSTMLLFSALPPVPRLP